MICGSTSDEINRRILAVAEDQLSGFYVRPFEALGAACGLPEETVMERMRAMLHSGAILRLRQTLPSTSLTQGCLIAWRVPEEKIDAAFDWLEQHDPFTGHIVIRRATDGTPGADYRLWTTLKVPAQGASLSAHAQALAKHLGAQSYACMPVVGMFTLSVGHIRRAGLQPGALQSTPPVMQTPPQLQLTPEEWRVLLSFRRPLAEHEITPYPWEARAAELGMTAERYYSIAAELSRRGALGRFAALLNHASPRHTGTTASALFTWTVAPGQEEAAGSTCGQHICMTHCYWRSGTESIGGAQIMGVVHSPSTEMLLAHKAAIDSALRRRGIDLRQSSVFYTVRSLIRPSEFAPDLWQAWTEQYIGR